MENNQSTNPEKNRDLSNPSDNCINQPCYELPEGMTIGRCKETGIMIELSLAKRQKLCDIKNNRESKQASEQKMSTTPTNQESDIYFAGFILRGTEEEIKAIKMFILTQTAAKLIYQKKDSGYLTFTKSESEK